MTQWFLRITAYADRSSDGLDSLDWTDRSKKLQRSGSASRMRDTGCTLPISRQRYWGPPIPIVHCWFVAPGRFPRRVAGAAAGDSGLSADRRITTSQRARVGCSDLPELWRFGRARDRRERHVLGLGVVLPTVPVYRVRRPSLGRERTRKVLPVDFYAGGSEHVQRHHLYARFVTMAMHDLGLVPFEEPIPRIRLGGLIRLPRAQRCPRAEAMWCSPTGTSRSTERMCCGVRCCSPPRGKGVASSPTAPFAGVERFLCTMLASRRAIRCGRQLVHFRPGHHRSDRGGRALCLQRRHRPADGVRWRNALGRQQTRAGKAAGTVCPPSGRGTVVETGRTVLGTHSTVAAAPRGQWRLRRWSSRCRPMADSAV